MEEFKMKLTMEFVMEVYGEICYGIYDGSLWRKFMEKFVMEFMMKFVMKVYGEICYEICDGSLWWKLERKGSLKNLKMEKNKKIFLFLF
jgi:hypothetical protein